MTAIILSFSIAPPPDTTPPTIAISSNSSKLIVGESALIEFELSESSSDFTSLISTLKVVHSLNSKALAPNTPLSSPLIQSKKEAALLPSTLPAIHSQMLPVTSTKMAMTAIILSPSPLHLHRTPLRPPSQSAPTLPS